MSRSKKKTAQRKPAVADLLSFPPKKEDEKIEYAGVHHQYYSELEEARKYINRAIRNIDKTEVFMNRVTSIVSDAIAKHTDAQKSHKRINYSKEFKQLCTELSPMCQAAELLTTELTNTNKLFYIVDKYVKNEINKWINKAMTVGSEELCKRNLREEKRREALTRPKKSKKWPRK
jgi:hypothetical protein